MTERCGYGLCRCGCGGKTNIATHTDARNGAVKGRPRRFMKGHQGVKQGPWYVERPGPLPTPCWIWRRSFSGNGYARIWCAGRKYRPAHIVYYERAHGPVPQGKELHHLCRNPACVNPDHVEPVTVVRHRQYDVTRLSDADVLEIRRLVGMPCREIGQRFGICAGYAAEVRAGRAPRRLLATQRKGAA